MIDISKVDDKNITFNGKNCAAVYKADAGLDDIGEYVLISEIDGAYKTKIRINELSINGVANRIQDSADAAANSLNQFIGNFKKGGGTSAKTSRAATVVVSCYDSHNKENADFICNSKPSIDEGDEVILQKAIDSVKSTGGEVLLKEGTYYLNSPIYLHNGITLRGMGSNATKIFYSDFFDYTSEGMICAAADYGQYKETIAIKDLYIECPVQGSTTYAINGKMGFLISNVKFTSNSQKGRAIYFLRGENLVVEKCFFFNLATGIYRGHGTLRVVNSTFFMCIVPFTTTTTYEDTITIDSCNFDTATFVLKAKKVIFTNNLTRGIANASSPTFTLDAFEVIISNNNISYVNSTQSGILINATCKALITGNYITSNAYPPVILVNSPKGTVISNNYIDYASTSQAITGIKVSSTGRNVVISGNVISFQTTATAAAYTHKAISIDGSKVSVMGNMVMPKTQTTEATYKFIELNQTSAECTIMGNIANGLPIENTGTGNSIVNNV